MIASFLNLTPEWLAERIERGQLVWLPSLIERDPEGSFAVVDQHMDTLTLAQQLRVIAARPDSASMETLRTAWYQVVDGLTCDNCTTSVEPTTPEDLVNVLVLVPGQEVADMLTELVELQKTFGDDHEHAVTIGAMFFSGNEAILSAALELALDEAVPPLPWVVGLSRLHSANSDAFQALVERRLMGLQSMNAADRDELMAGSTACHFSAMALYASLAEMDSPWPALFEEHRAKARQPGDCAYRFADILSIQSLMIPGLDAVLDLYLASDTPADSVNRLVSNFRSRRIDPQGRLAERLIDSSVWDELDQEGRDYLLGIQSSESLDMRR
ncbi:MAG: hypothetical protein AAGJ52_08305 [Pseudomonadota bacterium]